MLNLLQSIDLVGLNWNWFELFHPTFAFVLQNETTASFNEKLVGVMFSRHPILFKLSFDPVAKSILRFLEQFRFSTRVQIADKINYDISNQNESKNVIYV